MSTPLYRYEVANLFNDETFDVLPLPACQFDVRIGQPGSFSLPSPLGVANRQLGRRLQQVVPGATALYVYRNRDLWWGGITWIVTPAGDQNGNATWTVQASTFDSYMARVNFQHDLTVNAGDPLDQARALLSDMQSDPAADIGLIADTTRSGLSSPATTYLASSNSSYGAPVTALSSQDPGFDYACQTTVDPTSRLRTRRLRLGYPQLGGSTVHRLDRHPNGGNILTYSAPQDATVGGTECRAFGATSNSNQAGTSQPSVSGLYVASARLAAGWPRLDFGNMYSSISDVPTLNAHAQADLAAGTTPVTIPQITVRLDQTDITPASLGDTAVVSIMDANYPDGLSLTCRIVGIQVNTADRANAEYATLILN